LECASELLYAQLDASRSFLIKEYKTNILHIFDTNDFFKCTKQTLKYWSKIIDWVVSMDKGDLFTEYVNKVSSGSFLFRKDNETKHKIKAFERICFIIYSGEVDKYYGDQMYALLEKMGEVIKNAESSHPSLLILILFCLRVLILRLSPPNLTELLRHIWPILLTLMMQIFNRNNQKNPNLILAALKLLEIMSIVQLEEFYINQWIFVFDYFGLTIQQSDLTKVHPSQPIAEGGEAGENDSRPKVSGFLFQPYLSNVLEEDTKIDYHSRVLDVQRDFDKLEHKIIITTTNVSYESEIKEKAIALSQYWIYQNEFRTQADTQKVESLIEGDFISLDDYIFNIN